MKCFSYWDRKYVLKIACGWRKILWGKKQGDKPKSCLLKCLQGKEIFRSIKVECADIPGNTCLQWEWIMKVWGFFQLLEIQMNWRLPKELLFKARLIPFLNYMERFCKYENDSIPLASPCCSYFSVLPQQEDYWIPGDNRILTDITDF